MFLKISVKKHTRVLQPLFYIFIILMLGSVLISCDKKRPVIDLQDSVPARVERKAGAATSGSDSVLNVAIGAMISPEVTRDYYYNLLELVAEQMDCRLSISQRRTYAEVNELVEKQEVDLAFVCSGAYVAGHSDFNMELLVVPVSNGKSVYYSYIIANRNSEAVSLQDLKDKTFVFTDPDSNTGCLVPRYMLAKLNETPDTYFKKFYFTYSHDNSIKAVAEGLADGAAVDSLIWEYLNREGSESVKKTRIIERSTPFGIPPVVVNPEMDSDKKKLLKSIFLNIHKKRKAVVSLHAIQIERFDEGTDSMYDGVREMLRWVSDINTVNTHD